MAGVFERFLGVRTLAGAPGSLVRDSRRPREAHSTTLAQLRMQRVQTPPAHNQLTRSRPPAVIEITAIRLDGGDGHEHITKVLWRSASSSGVSTRQGLVDWLNAGSESQALVAGEAEHVPVFVVEALDHAPYVRTYADGAWTDHLLGLPKF
jgi:Protein of unknown function (DUF3892)